MALIKMRFGKLQNGFFLLDDCGEKKLFFACEHGEWSFPFPVRDGKIQRSSEPGTEAIFPNQEVEVIPREDWDEYDITEQMVKDFFGE
ncbi:MAG: hypothetical protein US83_C0001G0053 [Candidatus Falkowbacteria bacterium GW2011_GWC2_38_22]|uniref:Uncharacterized protein n=1 Tax=Candidatus Falkowbacteria bacterium GW2011_GWE1_38_31 TaxID=1618638 RepID=A0A0G0MB40_9BACT|nr:MAG: hypothetical protein US73_C0004G0075 [Candidatus Falkowbacteria bacterium GW2011_GWF2_38_1205]KKQ62119.1 MAG: hypothetical protein US83_C0001G0053 [Candidatus Falkowbacteria bacterium GW2011_GWC2_38_22]KKQ64269.1 MAG: hypothetical protein US84_C0001G0053 [Candidatus Falkowbacteria bacterium GW2011_GWF1_38_22]KKQ66246.1 MAG: hypothetical protein US87_C0002G0053 [Candidatus Falkowbacteria bacterium GW2011_GWE2_38_254]KKQ70974.1 MAG: hypothetical protein US91_C0002G0053 [Candidatus Falkowb